MRLLVTLALILTSIGINAQIWVNGHDVSKDTSVNFIKIELWTFFGTEVGDKIRVNVDWGDISSSNIFKAHKNNIRETSDPKSKIKKFTSIMDCFNFFIDNNFVYIDKWVYAKGNRTTFGFIFQRKNE